MLPKSKRLNLKKDFQWVASGSPRAAPASTRVAGGAGKKVETPIFKLFIKEGTNEIPKIGIAVSGKTFKKATDRNRAKRLISQAFQSIFHLLPPSINIVALPKVRVLEVKSSDVLAELESILKNEKILN